MKTFVVSLLLAVAVVSGGCAQNKPPNLSPAASLDYERTRAAKTLDLVRDAAKDLNSQTPQLLSTATTRKVINFHTLAIKEMDTLPDWKRAVSLALFTLSSDPSLLPAEAEKLRPYFDLVRSVLDSMNTPATTPTPAPTRFLYQELRRPHSSAWRRSAFSVLQGGK